MPKCKTCINMHNHQCEKIVDSPHEDDERECEHFKRMTQADRIRSMSDEELAEWLTSITDDAQSDAMTKCNYQWSEWLQSEVEVQHE